VPARGPFWTPIRGPDPTPIDNHRPSGETALNLELMRLIDAQFLETPWYGSRQMARHLRREGYVVGRKRIRRLMAKMGLAPI
jgi:putative transposase